MGTVHYAAGSHRSDESWTPRRRYGPRRPRSDAARSSTQCAHHFFFSRRRQRAAGFIPAVLANRNTNKEKCHVTRVTCRLPNGPELVEGRLSEAQRRLQLRHRQLANHTNRDLKSLVLRGLRCQHHASRPALTLLRGRPYCRRERPRVAARRTSISGVTPTLAIARPDGE